MTPHNWHLASQMQIYAAYNYGYYHVWLYFSQVSSAERQLFDNSFYLQNLDQFVLRLISSMGSVEVVNVQSLQTSEQVAPIG